MSLSITRGLVSSSYFDEIALRNVCRCLPLGSPANSAGYFFRSPLYCLPSLSWCRRPQHTTYWKSSTVRRRSSLPTDAMWTENGVLLHDVSTAALTSGIALGLLFFWGETAKKQIFEQKTTRKLVHISVGLVFMLCWPLFSPANQAPFLAAVAPGLNIIRMLLLGLGIWKNEPIIKSISRHGDRRELLKGPLYYACTITFSTLIFWRTSPIAIAAICNLCAGDGVADLVGRRFGKKKWPHNPDKSYAGTIAMAVAGFLASLGYMHYFASFGYIEESWGMILGFLLVSIASAIVESLPISSELDDNLMVPLTSLVVGAAVF